MMYNNSDGPEQPSSNNGYSSRRMPLLYAQNVFAHMHLSITRNYLLRKRVPLYEGHDSQHPLDGEVRSFEPSQLWVDVSEVERVISSMPTRSVRTAVTSRLEAILNRIV